VKRIFFFTFLGLALIWNLIMVYLLVGYWRG
jgi:hypothetical protein